MAKPLNAQLSLTQLKKIMGTKDTNRLYGWLQLESVDVDPLHDSFHGPVIDTNKWTVGNGGGASAASPAIDVGKQNGQAKMVTGTAGDNTASSVLVSGRHFTGDTNAIILVRLNINTAVTNVKVEIGFKDNILTSAGNGPVVNVMATPTFVATDGVAWCYDTNNTGVGWEGLGRANSVAATTDTGYNIAPVADTFETLGIALLDGVAFFMHFDQHGSPNYTMKGMAAAVTKTVLLAPYVYVEARSATSKTIDVDFVRAYSFRTTSNT